MPLVLRDRLSIWSVPWVFVGNLGMILFILIVSEILPWVTVAVAWVYTYLLLIQTRLIAALVISGTVAALIVPRFTDEFTTGVALWCIGIFAVSSVVAHGIAFAISAITGFAI